LQQGIPHQRRESFILELLGGDIYGNRQRRQTDISPGTPLTTGFVENPGTNRHDQPALLGNRNEKRGRNQFSTLAPANQGFRPPDTNTVGAELGLVMQFKFLFLQRLAQQTFGTEPGS